VAEYLICDLQVGDYPVEARIDRLANIDWSALRRNPDFVD
jgi:hypothetical protein